MRNFSLQCEKYLTTFVFMKTTAEQLLDDIEAAATRLSLAPSTVGRLAGQDGGFHSRLKKGCRVWPETANRVRERLALVEANKEKSTQKAKGAA